MPLTKVYVEVRVASAREGGIMEDESYVEEARAEEGAVAGGSGSVVS
jgi:hypothetical protein